jgi:hypothetical protein
MRKIENIQYQWKSDKNNTIRCDTFLHDHI